MPSPHHAHYVPPAQPQPSSAPAIASPVFSLPCPRALRVGWLLIQTTQRTTLSEHSGAGAGEGVASVVRWLS
jgi:hypothetical protein